ncbi:hypothetical protein JCM3775_002157 [Rhodotorula graminis]
MPTLHAFIDDNLDATPIVPLSLLPDSEADLAPSMDLWPTNALLDLLQLQLSNSSAPLEYVECAKDVVARCLPFYGPDPPSPRSYLESQARASSTSSSPTTSSAPTRSTSRSSSCDFGVSSTGRAELWPGAAP